MNVVWWAAIAAGAAAALPRKRSSHNLMKLPSFRGTAEVQSSLPGRMRIYMPAVMEAQSQALQMKSQLEGTGVIRRVDIQPRTGSVLIIYDETQVQAPVVLGAAMKLMGLDARIKAAPVGKVREGLKTLANAVNMGVIDGTNGLLDLPTLAGGALTIAALRNKAKYGWATPGAMTLLWWATRFFGVQSNE